MQSFERLAPYVGNALGLSADDLARSCRPAEASEIPAILELRRSVLSPMWWDDERYISWRYFSERSDRREIPFWVIVRNGEVLAACGLEPVTLVIDGVPMSAVRSLDIMVRPDLDGLGLGVFVNLVLFGRFPILLVTGSNERSHNLLMRMFHHATDLRFWKAPLRAKSIVDSTFGTVIGNVLAWSIDILLTAKRSVSRAPKPVGVEIYEMSLFDSRVTELSRRCETAARIMVRRDEVYLNWRFVQNPRCRYRIIGAFAENRLEGYVVTRLNLGRPNPRREGEIVDWLVAPASDSARSILAALVQAGTDGLARDGVSIATCAGVDPTLLDAMNATGFRLRPAERLPFFVKAADPTLHARLSAGPDWFLTRGDYDVE
jgi:hypothetical protein